MDMKRFGTVCRKTLPLVAIPFLFTYQSQARKRPNIIHIMSDDHSFQAISAYGHPLSEQAPTPNIDRLADEGMRFDRAYVENSLSTPSRACLMTGLYSHQNGQRRLGKGIDTSRTFVSELLQRDGYVTGVVGKWHMKCEPKGFDDYHILKGQGEYYNPRFKTPQTRGAYVEEEGYATELITRHAVDFIQKRDTTKPFCLFVHHKAPHRSWIPEMKYLELFAETDFPVPETFYDDYSTRGRAAHEQRMHIGEDMLMVYDLKVHEHSSMLDEKDKWQCEVNDQSLSELDETGRQAWLDAFSRQNKAYLAGVKVPEYMEGRSMKPVMKKGGAEPKKWRKYLYYHFYDNGGEHNVSKHDGVSDKRYKLIHFYGKGGTYDELYDLEKDPDELVNVIENPEYADVRSRLSKALTRFRKRLQVDEF